MRIGQGNSVTPSSIKTFALRDLKKKKEKGTSNLCEEVSLKNSPNLGDRNPDQGGTENLIKSTQGCPHQDTQ